MASWLATAKSVLESADLALESADSSTVLNANPQKISVWVWAFLFG